MNRPKPPALASWMLEHLARRTKNDALAGDLLEEFAHGRSASWYWRQVLVAILLGSLKKLRVASFGLVHALVWTVAVVLFWVRVSSPFTPLLHSILSWFYRSRFPFPWSTMAEISFLAAFTAIPTILGLGIYLVLSKKFTLSGFMLAGCVIFVVEYVVHVLAIKHYAGILFLTLALSMWAANGVRIAIHRRRQVRVQ